MRTRPDDDAHTLFRILSQSSLKCLRKLHSRDERAYERQASVAPRMALGMIVTFEMGCNSAGSLSVSRPRICNSLFSSSRVDRDQTGTSQPTKSELQWKEENDNKYKRNSNEQRAKNFIPLSKRTPETTPARTLSNDFSNSN